MQISHLMQNILNNESSWVMNEGFIATTIMLGERGEEGCE